jgi:hypothetical protein
VICELCELNVDHDVFEDEDIILAVLEKIQENKRRVNVKEKYVKCELLKQNKHGEWLFIRG